MTCSETGAVEESRKDVAWTGSWRQQRPCLRFRGEEGEEAEAEAEADEEEAVGCG